MRKTKIVCTIGPASESAEKLEELMLAGMNVARFNFSHGDYEEHRAKFERTVQIAEKLGLPVATMMDTKGPEIRLRDFEGGKVYLETGTIFALTTEEIMGTAQRAAITYKNLKDDVSIGKKILIDDGLIAMEVVDITDTDIICQVINGGYVSNHKGINVPGVVLTMPYISDVDREDILFGVKMGYDYIAASFVRNKEDVEQVRQLIRENGGNMKIISKIENTQGLENLEEIMEASDGIMVARGDLGVEVPLEEIPVLQKQLIKKAFSWMPKAMDGIKPVFIYPLLGTLLMGLIMAGVNPIIGQLNTLLANGLESLGSTSRLLLSIVLATMMATDMGGPFNKAAYVFGTAAIADGNTWIMAAVMIGGMVPPIAIALSTTFNKKKWNKEELKSGPVNYLMGLCFITEGAIPYAASDPIRVIPSCMVGSAVAGALTSLFNVTCPAPHGGIFTFVVCDHPLLYVVALVAGSVVGALMLALLKKNVNNEVKAK